MSVERGSIQLAKARHGDASTLARISQRAFDNDIHYGAPGPGGPPGYNSEGWQKRMIKMGDYFSILVADQIAGGVIVFRKKPREYELGRIFVEPDCQNQGIGTKALECLWQEYPLAKKWTLDTPAWNQRTHHFYQKLGFVEIGRDRRGLVLFERVVERPSIQKEE
jgi:GNAT superfamily N-acetyltransferase